MKKKKASKKEVIPLPDFPKPEIVYTDDPEDPIDISVDDPDRIPEEDPLVTPDYEKPPEGEGP